ncbi:polysaccharide deacetylase family protein [Desulfobacula sp.]|uniref:polysaccharide deacetylase family protein n=1 Tax=Desulfobacula sp. TaxID=2593537 RepID=UPI002714A28B|nr:polysaccharide deacetylase family protein [Desulfobacula sp.]
MDELEGSLANENDFTSPSVAITFDDGFLSNYTLAYPILKEFGLPAAMIYLSTGFIGTNNAPWVDELMDILSTTKSSTLIFPELLGDEVLNISTRHQKRVAVTKLFNIMLRLKHKQKIIKMQKLSKMLGVDEIIKENAERKMLNWDEVTEMSNNSISFGAHTISHPTLSKMEISEAKREICESKKEIEARIGKKVRHFAIPNGKKEDFSEKLKKYCKETGLKTVVSTEPGLVDGKSDPYFLRRILPPPPMYVFACELARYMFFKKIS